MAEVQGADEQGPVFDLPSAASTHEAPELLLNGPSLLRRLMLKSAEPFKFTLRVDDLFDGGGTEGADQLVLEILDAHAETQPFHVGASQVGAKAGLLQSTPEMALLPGITESSQSDAQPVRSEHPQETPDVRRASHRYDRDALGVKIPASALRQRFDRALVANPFHKDDGVWERGLCCPRIAH